MRLTRKHGCLAAVCILLIAGGYFAHQAYQLVGLVSVGIPSAYAVWNTAELVIDYMESHEQRWPKSWADLRLADAARKSPHGTESLDHLERMVEIDFGVDAQAFARLQWNQKPPFPQKAIRARSGDTTVWEGREPNEMVWYYLRGQYRGTTRPATTRSDG